MPKLSVIIPVLNENALLPKALDSLIHQTVEDFEVIIVDGGSTDGSVDTAQEACDRYVGFYLIQENFSNRFEAMNRGLKAAEGDYVIFLSARDFITDESIEQLIKLINDSAHKPDILVYRNYFFGEGIMPYFSQYDDLLAPLPNVTKYDYLCLRSFTLGNKCYRKAFLDNRKISFQTDNTYADYLFIYKAFVTSKHTVGCPCAFHEKRINSPSEGLEKRNEPTEENFNAFSDMFAQIYRIATEMIAEDSEKEADGEESYLQEIVYRYICMLYERFYSRIWFMDSETYLLFAKEYNSSMQSMNDDKTEKLKKMYAYLGAPYIFETRDKVDFLCTLALDFSDASEYEPFLDSLYFQSFPFFDVAVKKEVADSGCISEKYLNMPNLHMIDSQDFFAATRQISTARMVLIVKDSTPMHADVLKELSESRAPLFLRQSVFAKLRKTSEIKRTLKQKGLDIK